MRTVAGFFEQFAPGACQRRLTRIKLARRKLDHHRPHRVTVLAFHDQAPVVELGNDHHGAGMGNVFADGFAAVGQTHHVTAGLEKIPVKDFL